MLTHEVLALPLPALAGLIAVYVLGGTVKGVVGVGLPLLLVPLSAQFLDVPAAVALVSIPMVAANLTQSMEGGGTLAAVRAMLPVIVTLVVGTVIGVHLLVSIDRRTLNLVLGISFLLVTVLLLGMPRIHINQQTAGWAAPVVGFGSGVLGGMSAIFGPPMIAYLVGIGTEPNSFVKQMAIFASTASVVMVLALGGSGALAGTDFLVSAAAILPIQFGLPIGRWLRRRANPTVFRFSVLAVLAAGGIDMLHRAFP